MTDLQAAYNELRSSGKGHYAALRVLATELGLDVPTVARVLGRAEHTPRRERAV